MILATLRKVNGKYILTNPDLSLLNETELNHGYTLEVTVNLVDKRTISPNQRKFIFALCNEISHYTGDDVEYIRLLMQQYNSNIRNYEVQSLSNCSMTYANELIETTITFMLEQEIPMAKNLLETNKYSFNQRQTYTMCLKRICIICGRRADLHHVDAIGMGHDRKTVSHLGKRMLPLCREHHTEIHQVGDDRYMERYHLEPIIIDEKLEHFIKRGIIKVFPEEKRDSK